MVKLDPIAEFREDHRKVRDGLTEEVDKSAGITTFLSESSNAQMLFV